MSLISERYGSDTVRPPFSLYARVYRRGVPRHCRPGHIRRAASSSFQGEMVQLVKLSPLIASTPLPAGLSVAMRVAALAAVVGEGERPTMPKSLVAATVPCLRMPIPWFTPLPAL